MVLQFVSGRTGSDGAFGLQHLSTATSFSLTLTSAAVLLLGCSRKGRFPGIFPVPAPLSLSHWTASQSLLLFPLKLYTATANQRRRPVSVALLRFYNNHNLFYSVCHSWEEFGPDVGESIVLCSFRPLPKTCLFPDLCRNWTGWGWNFSPLSWMIFCRLFLLSCCL